MPTSSRAPSAKAFFLWFFLLATLQRAFAADWSDEIAKREAEADSARSHATALRNDLAKSEAGLKAVVPNFREAFEAVDKTTLDSNERQRLAKDGINSLVPEKARVLKSASASFKRLSVSLNGYFSIYDALMANEAHAILMTAVAEVYKDRLLLDEHTEDREEPKLVAFEGMREAEVIYRKYLVDKEAKNHHKSRSIDVLYDKAHAASEELYGQLAKRRVKPARGLSERLRLFGTKLKRNGRIARIALAEVPDLARALVYLYSPFQKTDPAKVNRILSSMATRYRWASGLKLEVRGREGLPSGHPIIFAPSHRSSADDAVIMGGTIPGPFAFLAAQRTMPAFLNDKFIKEPSIINVGGWKNGDRQGKDPGNIVDAVEESVSVLRQGLNLVIFPEGTTASKTRGLMPPRSGMQRIATKVMDRNVSVVAVAFDDPAEDWDEPQQRSFSKAYTVTVSFSRAIDPLKVLSVPGMEPEFLNELVRAYWHAELKRLPFGL